MPRLRWDGDYNNRHPENQTRVNLQAFGDLVEGVCSRLVTLAQKKELEICLGGGSDELVQRYMVCYPVNHS
jgi:hypothetical protein